MHWSKLKQRVESRFAPRVVGRVELRLTSYRHAHDSIGRGWITIDGEEVANFCYWSALQRGTYCPELDVNPNVGFGSEREITKFERANRGTVMDTFVYCETLVRYLSMSLEEALTSTNYLSRALAMVDRRLGKRRLVLVRLAFDEHDLVKRFYRLRRSVEGLDDEPGRLTYA